MALLLLTTDRLRSFALFLLAGIAASLLTTLVTRWSLARTGGQLPARGLDLLGRLRRARPQVLRLFLPALRTEGVAVTARFREGGERRYPYGGVRVGFWCLVTR